MILFVGGNMSKEEKRSEVKKESKKEERAKRPPRCM